MGIISGISRQSKHPDGHMIEEMLQTDASVNPGNSGGPLIDSRGFLLGVNTLGMGETVNFAVSADTVLYIVPELIEHGNIERGSLGISVSASWVESGNESREMIQVRSVSSHDSPLRPGDCFVSIDSIVIEKRVDIQRALNRKSVGRSIDVELLRDGKLHKKTVVPELKKM
jgi:S1-C subfamily serine protease